MSSKLPSGLKAPSKIGKPTGLPTSRGSGLPTPSGSRAQSALEKSARAAGLSSRVAESYAADMIRHLPGPEYEPRPAPPTDDLIIGDRVWVGGTKPGHIAFIGETQFAPAEWAGIVLDEPVGKNDGSVAGVRYFQCEMKRGVFARLAKLTKERTNHVDRTPDGHHPDGAGVGPPTAKTANGGTVLPPSANKHTVAKIGGMVKKAVGGSATNLHKSPSRSGSLADLTPMLGDSKYPFSIGDRVLVSGSKAGILRYIGGTDFAKGEWAGVELDDPFGKNDGAVAGKRYFSCKPMFGLFAPVHKVTRSGMTSSAIAASLGVTPSPHKGSLPKYGLGMSLPRERSGSQDSISSISSNTSSVSRSRVRLGVTSLSNQSAVASHIHRMKGSATGTPQTIAGKTLRPTTLNLSATNTALQKTLKEKEEHIEQLLRERDMERSELARAASQVDEAESMLTALKVEHQRHIEDSEEQQKRLRVLVDEATRTRSELQSQLEEERRKVEDMQFTIEEEAINKGDLENLTATDHAKLTELQDQLAAEKARADKLQDDMQTWKKCYTEEKARFKDAEDSSVAFLDQIEELTHKLGVSEGKLKGLEEAKAAQGSKASEASEALAAKSLKVTQLEEALSAATRETQALEGRLSELTEDLTSGSGKQQKQGETIDELMRKLASSDTNSHTLGNEVQQLKLQIADLQRQVTASEEKSSNLEDDKSKLEEQIGELVANSGDSSQQLSLMSEQLRDKERKLEELQAGLSDSTQKIGKLNETIEINKLEAERELEIVLSKHSEDLASFDERLCDKQTELDKSQAKFTKVQETLENEKAALEKKKDSEIVELRGQVESSRSEVDALKTESESTKESIIQLNTERDNIKFEKEKFEKNVKRLESEKEKTVAERDAAVSEKEHLILEQQSALSEMGEEQQKIKKLSDEKEELLKLKLKLEEELNKLQIASKETQVEIVKLQGERREVDGAMAELEKSTKDKELAEKDAQQKMLAAQQEASEYAGRLKMVETEREALKVQVAKLKTVQQEKQVLEANHVSLQKELESVKRRETKKEDDFEIERSSLQKSLDSTQLLLQQKGRNMEQLQNELTVLQGENSLLRSQAASLSTLEQEKQVLQQSVSKLERSLAESQANANVLTNVDTTGDPVLAALKADKESSEKQVDFLNSVIVDMQRKNEELTLRLRAMESGEVVNGAHDDNYISTPRKPAPRLFCDICDRFDLHDTDDCPTQAMSDSPPATSYHGERNQERPYCTICEMFGHWTQNCDDEQTF